MVDKSNYLVYLVGMDIQGVKFSKGKLRALRQGKGLKLGDVAKILDTTVRNISKMETQGRSLNADTLFKFCIIYGVFDIREFFESDTNQKAA